MCLTPRPSKTHVTTSGHVDHTIERNGSMEDELRARLEEAKRKAAKRNPPCREVVFAHVLRPMLLEWISKQPRPDPHMRTWDRSDRVHGELADAARMPARRLYALLHGEDVAVSLDTADRLMIAIDLHINYIEHGIVSSLEADAYARWQRGQIQAWWESTGRVWPPDSLSWRKQMTGIRRAYYEAHKEVAV